MRYNTNQLEPALGFAVATGVLRTDELPEELLQHLAGWIDFHKDEETGS